MAAQLGAPPPTAPLSRSRQRLLSKEPLAQRFHTIQRLYYIRLSCCFFSSDAASPQFRNKYGKGLLRGQVGFPTAEVQATTVAAEPGGSAIQNRMTWRHDTAFMSLAIWSKKSTDCTCGQTDNQTGGRKYQKRAEDGGSIEALMVFTDLSKLSERLEEMKHSETCARHLSEAPEQREHGPHL